MLRHRRGLGLCPLNCLFMRESLCGALVISAYATAVRWMIISFTNTDLDRFVNNITEK